MFRLFNAIALLVLLTNVGRGERPRPISAEQFSELHKSIKVQPGESRFWQVPWLLDTWEARRKAAEEGKPILVWAGSQGPPIGGC